MAVFQILVSEEDQSVNISDWRHNNIHNNLVHVTILLQEFLSVISWVGVFPHSPRFSLRVLNASAGICSIWMVEPITGILDTRTKG